MPVKTWVRICNCERKNFFSEIWLIWTVKSLFHIVSNVFKREPSVQFNQSFTVAVKAVVCWHVQTFPHLFQKTVSMKKALCRSVSNISITYLLADCFHNQTLAENKGPPLCLKAISFSRYQLFEQVLGTVWSESINRIKKSQRDGGHSLTNIRTATFQLLEYTVGHSNDKEKHWKNKILSRYRPIFTILNPRL